MNVEIGAEAAQFSEKEYLNGIAVAVQETVFKEKHGVWDWDPIPELTITSPYGDSNTCTMGDPMPESTLSPVRD